MSFRTSKLEKIHILCLLRGPKNFLKKQCRPRSSLKGSIFRPFSCISKISKKFTFWVLMKIIKNQHFRSFNIPTKTLKNNQRCTSLSMDSNFFKHIPEVGPLEDCNILKEIHIVCPFGGSKNQLKKPHCMSFKIL